jgi:hypothetical protein
MRNIEKTHIWHLDVRRETLQLVRITRNEYTTRLDFGYQMDQMYVNNWWINIYPNTHLLTSASTNKFRMQDQLNIAVAPNKTMYKARTDWQFFSLFFAPLPLEDQKISLIEFEDTTRGFNMYDIELKLSDAFIMKG